jgi:hypothetical protein
MALKQSTITLTSSGEAIGKLKFHVVEVTNSTEFIPGAELTKKEVDDLCAAKHWTVKIRQPKAC